MEPAPEESVELRAQALIAELRNRRNSEQNWKAFRALIENNREKVLQTFSSRRLVSVCDTYADFAGGEQSRNALLISLLINLIRVSDTLFESSDLHEERLLQKKAAQFPLFDGLYTLDINNQDACLNLAKRLTRAFHGDPLMQSIYLELLRRLKAHDNLLTRLARLSSKPERVFPLNPLKIEDNYGIL